MRLFIFIMLLAMTPCAAAENRKEINWEDPAHILAELDASGITSGLKSWYDAEAVFKLAETEISEDLIKGLYRNFREIVVAPPNPNVHTKYTLENKDEYLYDMKSLGQLLHNLLIALSGEDRERYGTLVGLMRAVLYMDYQHIPLALKNDDSRDFYWYEAHNRGVKAAEKEYASIFGD